MHGDRQRDDSQRPRGDLHGWQVDVAVGEAARRAAELALSHLPEPARQQKVEKVVAAQPGQNVLLSARRVDADEREAGALLIDLQPGRVAIVWPPQLRNGAPPELREVLVRRGTALLAGRDVLLAQALLRQDDQEQRGAFRAAGYQHATDLAVLRCDADGFPETSPAVKWQTECYTPANHARLAGVILASYEGTLDCPQLNGLRDVEDVLTGYRATGRFDPDRWLLVRDGVRDAGCLLLTSLEDGTWELLYVGLHPEFRGRGWGAQLVRHAGWLARQAGARGLELAVDTNNTPALASYATAGLHAVGQRALWVCYGECLQKP